MTLQCWTIGVSYPEYGTSRDDVRGDRKRFASTLFLPPKMRGCGLARAQPLVHTNVQKAQ
jgi:hypothetical protein